MNKNLLLMVIGLGVVSFALVGCSTSYPTSSDSRTYESYDKGSSSTSVSRGSVYQSKGSN